MPNPYTLADASCLGRLGDGSAQVSWKALCGLGSVVAMYQGISLIDCVAAPPVGHLRVA